MSYRIPLKKERLPKGNLSRKFVNVALINSQNAKQRRAVHPGEAQPLLLEVGIRSSSFF